LESDIDKNRRAGFLSRYSFREFINRAKNLNGEPHYIAMGMAIGVFIGITPTIPFHTILAVLIAFICRGSKPAAMVGVWFSNPLTIPLFYYASYKAGNFILGKTMPFDQKYDSILELAKIGFETTIAMLTGGVVIGIIPAILSYFITKKIFMKIRSKKNRI
jgi:uncharacterized protein (DUF2062 family)